MSVRAKFKCISVTSTENSEVINLKVVTNDRDENKEWSKYTPDGSLNMTVTNPLAFGEFKAGEEYLITIEHSPVD